MSRDDLFKSMGFECIGAMIEGIFTNIIKDMDYEMLIWIDWKNKRVMLDNGDESDVIFLKGGFKSGEENIHQEYENNNEKEISDANNFSI